MKNTRTYNKWETTVDVLILRESDILEKSSEMDGLHFKYASIYANAHFNNGQKKTLIWCKNVVLEIDSIYLNDSIILKLVKDIIKQGGGLLDIST